LILGRLVCLFGQEAYFSNEESVYNDSSMLTQSDIQSIRSEAALQTLVTSRFDSDYSKLVQAINSAVNALLSTDLQQADRFVAASARCFALMPAEFQPHLIAIEGRLDHWRGNHKTALSKYLDASHRFRQCGARLAAARLGQGLMDVYMYLGRYDDALATGKRSLAYFRRHDLQSAAARVMTNIGNIYHRLDKNRLALDYYNKARDIFAKKGGLALATVEFNRANIYTNLNRLDEAADLYNVAAEIYHEAGVHLLHEKARYSIAYLYFLADRFTEALKLFESVYEAFSALGDRKAVAVTRLDLVEMNIHLNQFGTAIMHGYEIVQEFRELGMRYEQGKAGYFVALARMNLGDFHLAAGSLREAERLFRQERNLLWQGMVNLARSKLHLEAGRPALALKAAATARSQFAKSGDQRRSIDADIVYAEALFRTGDDRAARQRAGRLLKAQLVSYQTYYLQTLLGEYYFNRRQYTRALESYQHAVDVVERMLGGLFPDEIRFFFVADKLAAYVGVVQCQLELGRPEESFLTNLRALATINRRRFPSDNIEAQVPASLLATREQLRASLKKLGGFPDASHRGLHDSDSLIRTEHELWSTEQRIRAHLYPSQHRREQQRPGRANLRDLLRDDETLISYVAASGGGIGAFCATQNGVTYLPLAPDGEKLRQLVWEMYFVLEKTVFDSGAGLPTHEATSFYLKELYRLLIKPVADRLTTPKLLLLADGIFAQIPYAALEDENGTRLKDRYDIRMVVNPDDLMADRTPPLRFAQAHNSIFALTSERLPAVAGEAEGIHNLYGRSRYYVDSKADSIAFKGELDQADGFVHIATHASRSSENPLFSRLVLADGPFFPFDLFSSGIRAELVTLSGCQTAATGLYYGNSFSLAKAFYQAGSRYVLASLWPVSDSVSMSFMVAFYGALKKTNDVSRAYRTAMDSTTDSVGEPALWGAFVLLGL